MSRDKWRDECQQILLAQSDSNVLTRLIVGGVIEGHVGQRANCGSGRRPWARRPEKRRSTGACANRREFVQKIADYRVGVGSRLSRILVEGGPPVGQSPLEIIKDHEDIELSLRVVQMINQG